MSHNHQHIEQYHAGDALEIEVAVEDDDGNPLDISGANEIEWLLKNDEQDADEEAILTKTLSGDNGITLTDGANGEFTVKLDTGDTAGNAGTKHHRARLVDSAGDRSTLFTGRFDIDH